MSGQAVVMRLENAANFGSLPGASAGTKGRIAYDVALKNTYIDIGGTWQKLGSDVYENIDAATWTGSVASHTYDVSGTFVDARRATWQFQDNSNNRQIMQGALISFPSATTVNVLFDNNLAVGTYTLIGIG